MKTVRSTIGRQPYRVDIHSSTGNVLIADEPESLGGGNLGFSPDELLASALAACTSATLRMYADRKGWDLQEVRIDVEVAFMRGENRTVIQRVMEFVGDLDEAQKSRLTAIANACPVHKMLTGSIEVVTRVAD